MPKNRSLSFLTMNVCGLPGTGFASRGVPVGRAIGRLKPDLVALQEVFTDADVRKIDPGVGIALKFRRKRLGMVAGGLVLYSRLPLAEARFISFKEQGSWYRLSVLARVNQKGFIFARWEEPRLGILNTHILANYTGRYERGSYSRWQMAQITQLLDFIEGLDPTLPLIILGDFNVPPNGNVYERLRGAGLIDAMAGSNDSSMVSRDELDLGILAPNEALRLDYAFLRPGGLGKPDLRCEYVLDKEGLSDHRGLLARLKFD